MIKHYNRLFHIKFSHLQQQLGFSILENPKWLEAATMENSLQRLKEENDGSDQVFQERSLVRAALMGHGENLKHCPSVIRNDKELVVLAVRNNRYELALEFASEEMRNDKEIVEESMRSVASSFRFASESIRDDKEMGLKALSYMPSNILYLSESLQKDVDIIEKALELDGDLIMSLNYKQEELLENKNHLFKILNTCSMFCRRFIFTYLQSRMSNLLKDQEVLEKFVCTTKNTDKCVVDPGENIIKMVAETCDLNIDRDLILKQVELFKYASIEIRSDRDFVLGIVRKRGCLLEYASTNLRDDFDIVLNAVVSRGNSLCFASERLRNYQRICYSAVKSSSNQFRYASSSLKSNKKFILSLIHEYPKIFEFVDENLKSDLQFLKEAIKVNHNIVRYIANIDKEILQLLMNNHGLSLISKTEIQKYRKEILEYLINYPKKYSSLANKFPNDKELALKFLSSSPYSIRDLSHELQNDSEIIEKLSNCETGVFLHYGLAKILDKQLVKEKLKKYPEIMLRLPEEFQKDRELVLEAVKSGGSSSITKFFRNDRDIVMESLKGMYFNLGNISTELRKDKEIVSKSISIDPSNIVYADYVFKSDKEFVKKCLENSNKLISYSFMERMPESMRDDYELATIVLKNDPNSFSYLSERLRNDRSFAFPIIMKYPYLLRFSPILCKDKQTVLTIIQTLDSSFFMSFLPEELQEDLDIIRASFKRDPLWASQYCQYTTSNLWTQHKDLVKIVLPHYPEAFYKASEEIRKDREIHQLFISNVAMKSLIHR